MSFDDLQWLDPIRERTKRIEAETERIREENQRLRERKAMQALERLYKDNEKAMRKLAKTDWEFSDEAETQFVEWFHSDHDLHLLRSDYFYEDCKTRDLSTLESLMAKWLHIAFISGFERGRACN